MFINLIYHRESIEINIRQGKKAIKQSPEKVAHVKLLLVREHYSPELL